ncbi:MAG: TatD family hydrolase [Sulfuricella sp.]
MLIDTHCHLDAAEFAADRDQVAARARAAGVEAMVVPAVEYANFADVLACRANYPGCHAALGIHPMYVGRSRPDDLAQMRAAVAQHQPVAIGEIGLDFFVPDFDAEGQEVYFSEQLKIARDFDLPVLLHIRRAQDQILKHLRRIKVKGGIAHAFNGSRQQADAFIGLGFKLGFGGAMTYPRATRLRELAATLPLEAMVLETDAPDMAPVFAARERNSPEYLPRIAQILADLRGISFAEVANATSVNARAVLGVLG